VRGIGARRPRGVSAPGTPARCPGAASSGRGALPLARAPCRAGRRSAPAGVGAAGRGGGGGREAPRRASADPARGRDHRRGSPAHRGVSGAGGEGASLKNACRVEALQLSTRERLERALALVRGVAGRLARLMRWGRPGPDLDAELLCDRDEGKAAFSLSKKPVPRAPPRLNEGGAAGSPARRLPCPPGRWRARRQDPLARAPAGDGFRDGAQIGAGGLCFMSCM
jgi:hypothetical protein